MSMGNPPHTSDGPWPLDPIPPQPPSQEEEYHQQSQPQEEEYRLPSQSEQYRPQPEKEYPHCLLRHPRPCSTMDGSLHTSRGRGSAAVRPESYLAVRPTGAYLNLPPAVDVETVEEAKMMLARWEAWNQQLPKQLEMDVAFSPVNRMNGRESAASLLSTPSHTLLSHGVEKGRNTSLSQNIVGTPSNTSVEVINHSHEANKLHTETRGTVLKPRPFAVAYRVTAATLRRRTQPASTRQSRALLLKRALDLEGKPLGRTGGNPNDVNIEDHPSAGRDDSKSTADMNIPFPRVALSTESEEKQDPLAVAERLRLHLKDTVDALEADSVISRLPNRSTMDSNSDYNSTWPKPPSHFQHELVDCKESMEENIHLLPCVSVLIPNEDEEEEEKEVKKSSNSLPLLHGVSVEGTEENRILMESDEKAEDTEDSEEEEKEEEEPKEVMEGFFFSSCSESPPQGFPIVVLGDHAVSIFPTPLMAGDEVESNMDSKSNVELPTPNGAGYVDDEVVRTMEVVNRNNISGSDSKEMEQPVYSKKANLLTFEEKETQNYDSNSKSDKENEKSQQNTNPKEKGIFKYEYEYEEEEGIAENENTDTVLLPRITHITHEVMNEECTARVSLILAETLQLCELWQLCHTEGLRIAETPSTSWDVRDEKMTTNTTDHSRMNDAFTQCNMEELNIIMTSSHQQQQIYEEAERDTQCFHSEIARLNQKIEELQGPQEEREKNECDIKLSLQASKTEVNHLKELLDKESKVCKALKSELQKTVEELQRVNSTTASAVKATEEREAALMEKVCTLEAQLNEKESTMQQICEKAERDTQCFHSEIARLNQKVEELQELQEEREKIERDIKLSLQASKTEVNHLKELLDKESNVCNALKSELQKTVEELQRVNSTTASLMEEREEIAAQLRLAQSDATAISQAARVRQSELQSEALAATVREHRALTLAAALERSLLLAVSNKAECTARLRLLTMKTEEENTNSNEVYELYERRLKEQLLASMALIARNASHMLARRYLSHWGRVCYLTRCQRMARLQRENRERQRELTLWCEHLSLANSGGIWGDAGEQAAAAAVGNIHSTATTRTRTPLAITGTTNTNTINTNNNTINTTRAISERRNRSSTTAASGSRTVVDTAETDTVTQLDAKDAHSLLDLRCMLTREREITAKLILERNALREALRDSTAVNTELLQQLESKLESTSHPAAV